MMKTSTLFLVASLLVLPAVVASAGDASVTLVVQNMTCALCPLTVTTAIKRVEGVKDVTVDYKTKTAIVVFDDSRTTVDKIAKVSTRAGYPASEVK